MEKNNVEKIWLKHYPAGIPAEINPDESASIADQFNKVVRKFADHPAVSNMGSTLTYTELDIQAAAFAAYLQNELNLKKGDRLAIMLPNLIQYLVAIYGAFKAGLVVVNVNPLYTSHELIHQLNDAGVETVLVLANFAATVEKALPKTTLKNIIVTELGDEFSFVKKSIVNFIVKRVKKMVPKYQISNALKYKDVLAKGKNLTLKEVPLCGDDLAFLQYTGGTTGVSKGAMLTHRNMVANVEQAYHWMKPFMDVGNDAVITALPLYHIFSLLANALVFMRAGSENILITNPRDIPGFIKELRRKKFTAMIGVNTLFNAMVNHKDIHTVDFSDLRVVLGGGMAVQKAVANKWKAATGIHILEAYGLTETSPAVTINPLTLTEFNGSIGLPLPSTEIKIIDADGNELPLGEPGELCVRGPQVMKGYWNMPEETSGVFLEDGWLLTGDVATVNEKGFVYIVDRKKDMVDISGFNVYPNEVEEIIAQHPGVLEVAVIGVPHKIKGEALKAFIVKKDASLEPADIIKFCREYLTAYKVPKLYEFRSELPKSNVGKILRRALREKGSIVQH